jgi:hypothetical protein
MAERENAQFKSAYWPSVYGAVERMTKCRSADLRPGRRIQNLPAYSRGLFYSWKATNHGFATPTQRNDLFAVHKKTALTGIFVSVL